MGTPRWRQEQIKIARKAKNNIKKHAEGKRKRAARKKKEEEEDG